MRRVILSVCLLLVLALPCPAQDEKPKPNTLTAKEIADGWILLFDGETTFGWKADLVPGEGKWNIADGIMQATLAYSITCTTEFPDFELRFEYKLGKQRPKYPACVGIKKVLPDGIQGSHFQRELDLAAEWTPIVFRLRGRAIEIEGPGFKDASTWDYQRTPVITFDPVYDLKLRNVKLKPLKTQSLFNGKDITDWKEFAGKKSKFSVTEKGELNVKDGPGDLQTVGKYKDFVLQLDCISNGKHLNSGIFFRCKDGEYQNGYEAQIFNKFAKEPTQKYSVEEYDPKSNKLLAKKEVLSPAFDFGTGAIYRRAPARKEMSKDNEWFGMTIVAHGNHIATWVNGVQVVDWLDHRPKSDNPRNGCRLEAGHISIQGHDPTTDLTFKNIRIAEYK